MWDVALDFGKRLVGLIVALANAVVSREGAPGLVAIIIVALFLAACWALLRSTSQQVEALTSLRRRLERSGNSDDPMVAFTTVDAELKAASHRNRAHRAVATAWSEYRETHIVDETGSTSVIRNSVRPTAFFNLEDLGFGVGWMRVLPNLFVALGLLLTFLGLIAVLTSFGQDIRTEATLRPEQMGTLLSAASAKFIMSLAGLFCSILFTIALRQRSGVVEKSLHDLNGLIEDRLSFLSQEDIALRALREQEEMRSLMQGLATDIAAQLNQSLTGSIGGAIRDGLAPLIDRLQAESTAGVGAMVENLSERLAGDVGRALAEASGRLEIAAERLVELADKLSASGGAASERLEAAGTAAATRLQEGLAQLETRAEAGAGAIESSAKALAQAVGGLEAQIGAAGRRAEAAMNAESERMLTGMRDRLMTPFGDLARRVTVAAEAAQAAGKGLREAAEGALRGGTAARAAGEAFSGAARDFTAASEPLVQTAGRIEASNRAVEAAARGLADTAAASARAAETALATAEKALGGKQQAIAAVLARLKEITEHLEDQGAQMEEIDEMLGRSLDQYNTAVRGALEQLEAHVRSLQKELQPALDTLREVVEQAEAFRPKVSGRRG